MVASRNPPLIIATLSLKALSTNYLPLYKNLLQRKLARSALVAAKDMNPFQSFGSFISLLDISLQIDLVPLEQSSRFPSLKEFYLWWSNIIIILLEL